MREYDEVEICIDGVRTIGGPVRLIGRCYYLRTLWLSVLDNIKR